MIGYLKYTSLGTGVSYMDVDRGINRNVCVIRVYSSVTEHDNHAYLSWVGSVLKVLVRVKNQKLSII